MNPKIRIFKDGPQIAAAFTEVFAKKIELIVEEQPDVKVAISGGSTPRIWFNYLVNHFKDKLPWSKLHFYWVDERCVPPDDEQSNYGMTYTHLLHQIEIPEANVHRVRGEDDPETEAERYGQLIKQNLPDRQGWPKFDVIILGMGDDGHTASIFPDQLPLLESEKVCAVGVHPDSGQKRITLTGKVINQADWIAFMVTGQGKSEMVAKIVNQEPDSVKYPARHIVPEHGFLEWYLDEAAATKLN